MDEQLLLDAAENLGGAYRYWAAAMGKPSELREDLSLGDLGVPVPLPVNNATPLRPPADIGNVLERVERFFAASPGGGYEMWSVWPLPEPPADGYDAYKCPLMIREAGGEVPPAPAEIRIVEATGASEARDLEVLLDAVYGCRSPEPGSLFRTSAIGEGFMAWVGYVDDEPVSTASAYVGGGFVGVYAVATAESARGRGYGEALTWAATMFRPDLPATLQASPMGFPVYERMGYRRVSDCTVWYREQR